MKLAILLISAASATSALSMNVADVPVKCTDTAGKVSYQRGSCPPGNKIEIVRNDALPSQKREEWTFLRSVDSMTNAVSCVAHSPDFYIPAKREYVTARLAVLIDNSGAPIVMLHTKDNNSVFHHNIGGTGLKIGQREMAPFGSRPTQTVLALPKGLDGPAVDMMHISDVARARVRFWPWDETFDSHKISLQNFKQAVALAKNCAANR